MNAPLFGHQIMPPPNWRPIFGVSFPPSPERVTIKVDVRGYVGEAHIQPFERVLIFRDFAGVHVGVVS